MCSSFSILHLHVMYYKLVWFVVCYFQRWVVVFLYRTNFFSIFFFLSQKLAPCLTIWNFQQCYETVLNKSPNRKKWYTIFFPHFRLQSMYLDCKIVLKKRRLSSDCWKHFSWITITFQPQTILNKCQNCTFHVWILNTCTCWAATENLRGFARNMLRIHLLVCSSNILIGFETHIRTSICKQRKCYRC